VTIYDESGSDWRMQIGRPLVQDYGTLSPNISHKLPGSCGFLRPSVWGERAVLIVFEIDIP